MDKKQFLDKYTEQYGKLTVIFYQMGKFHEVYGVDNDVEKIPVIKHRLLFININ